jgi:ketosteroid isomerase-like protein
MSEANVDAIRAVYEQWARGNFRAGVEIYDREAMLVQRPGFPGAGTYVGTAEIADYMRTFLEAWDRMTIAAEELIDAGDRVVVAVHRGGPRPLRGSARKPDPPNSIPCQQWPSCGGARIGEAFLTCG